MSRRLLRPVLAGLLGLGLTLLANAAGCGWMRGSDFASGAFYDGSALFLTLATPALLGGLLMGRIAQGAALNTAAAVFVPFCTLGLWRPFWQIPQVTVQSAHSGLLHYFLYNPLVALAFGTLGAWLSGQFATGRWTFADREPVVLPEPED